MVRIFQIILKIVKIITYFRGNYRSKNKSKGPEFEMVSLYLETGKC